MGRLLLPTLVVDKGLYVVATPRSAKQTFVGNGLAQGVLVDIHDMGTLLDEDGTPNIIGNLRDGANHVVDGVGTLDGVVLGLPLQQMSFECNEVDLVVDNVAAYLFGGVCASVRVGIFRLGQRHDTDIQSLGQNHVDTTNRGMYTGSIAIVNDGDIVGETFQ